MDEISEKIQAVLDALESEDYSKGALCFCLEGVKEEVKRLEQYTNALLSFRGTGQSLEQHLARYTLEDVGTVSEAAERYNMSVGGIMYHVRSGNIAHKQYKKGGPHLVWLPDCKNVTQNN